MTYNTLKALVSFKPTSPFLEEGGLGSRLSFGLTRLGSLIKLYPVQAYCIVKSMKIIFTCSFHSQLLLALGLGWNLQTLETISCRAQPFYGAQGLGVCMNFLLHKQVCFHQNVKRFQPWVL